jgi:ribosomal-protein-serine acetyltransferase
MDPILIDVPAELTTERLLIRPPRAGDGAEVNAAIVESAAELQPWMPWANPVPTVEQSEAWCRKSCGEFILRKTLMYQMYLRDGGFVGGCGIHDVRWEVRRFEIGYWVRTPLAGRGYVTEAVARLTRLLFEELGAQRVEIRCDERNLRSARIPERLGYRLEGTLRHDSLDANGSVRSTRVYAKIG